MRILLVEDHADTADRIAALLQKAQPGIEVFHAGTLAEGIAKSSQLKITLPWAALP
jgi:DNA-binding response OmpR family regulator